MRTAMIHGVRDLRVHSDRPKPTPGPGEVLVKVRAVGVCGSDLHYYLEGGIGSARIAGSMTPGHELGGEVVEGSGEAHGLPDGTLVALDPACPCGDCDPCRAGYGNLCPHVRFLGTPDVAGGLSEFVTAPAGNLVPLPPGLDATDGALLEPLGVALHAVDITRVKPMTPVAVVGAGPIGLLVGQVARVAGAATVRFVEPHPGRREAARKLALGDVHADWEEALRATAGRGHAYVIEATNSPEGPEHAAQLAAIGGRVTLVGIPEGDRFHLTAGNARRKGLTVKFSRRMGHVYPRAIDLVAQGRVDLRSLVTHRYSLPQAEEAFATAARLPDDFVKAVIHPAEP